MRAIVLSISVFAAACSGQVPGSPTSPTGTTATLTRTEQPGGSAETRAQNGTGLPFHGTFTGHSSSAVDCPPACPPSTLTISGTVEGRATHLGSFSAAFVDVVNLATKTGTGTLDFTAANGDRLLTTTTGGEDGFTEPNISSVTQIATVTGGTGRFAGATGTLTVRYTQVIDFANGTATKSGSFEGQLNLNN